MASYVWDTRARRYRTPGGQFLSSGRVLRSLEADLRNLNTVADRLADDFRSGRLSLVEWRVQMQTLIKHVHLGAATLAKGGRAQMGPEDYGRVGQLIQQRYRDLEGWTSELAAGTAPTDGRLSTRARLYVTAARPTYVTVRLADLDHFDQERSILSIAEHCGDCVAQAERGWQPRGQMIPIGERQCGDNDKCRVELRNSQTGEVIAA